MFIGQNQFCSPDLLAKIADVIDSAVLITRLGSSGQFDQRIIYINQAFTNVTGYVSEELLGRSIDAICDPRTGTTKMLEFYSNCRTGQQFAMSVDSFRKSGGELKLKFEVRPLVDNVQGAYYYIIMCKVDAAAQSLGHSDAFRYSQPQQQQQSQQQQQAAPYSTQYSSPQFGSQFNFVQQPSFTQNMTPQAFAPSQPQPQPAPTFSQPNFGQQSFVQPAPIPSSFTPSFAQTLAQQQQPAPQYGAEYNLPELGRQTASRAEAQPEAMARPEPRQESARPESARYEPRTEGYQYYARQAESAATFSQLQDPQPQPDSGYPSQDPEDYGIPVAPVVSSEKSKTKKAEIKTDDKVADYCKTQFLANMSHDLRTPLNAIIGFSEVIKDQLFGPIENNRYVSYASDIHKSGQELLSTINEIMELSEVSPEADKIEEDKVDLGDIVESVLDVLSPKAFESDVKIIKALDAEDVKFKGDRRKLKQMVAGVINNALKYSKKGSKIELSTSITDRGDYRLVIYAPTAHLASSKSSLGSLLGTVTKKMENDNPEIALARKFVEAHQGKFSIFHSASSGTEINVTLPSTRISIEPEKKTWLKVIS